MVGSTPEILNLRRPADRRRLVQLLTRNEVQHIVDDYREQQREYFAVKNPSLAATPDFERQFDDYLAALERRVPLAERGRWIYYPWFSTVVHLLEDRDFQLVRTARNRNLVTAAEQAVFYNATVGIGGLSIGNSVALAIVLQGGAQRLRLADFDRLALTNLNRIRTGVHNLGLRKVEMTARQIYAMNPYSKVELFTEGLTPKNIRKFFAGPPKLDIVIDELDNIAVKYLIREEARRHRVAVVMAADNGDNAVIDIERYDIHHSLPFFHGRLGKVSYEKLKDLSKLEIGRAITKHIGPENVTERMQQSLLEVGKKIVSWPQLGGAALLNGSAVAYCVRKILNKQSLERDRALVSLDEKLVPGYQSPRERRRRRANTQKFRQSLGLP